MRSILFHYDEAADDLLIADFWESGTSGIIEEQEGWRAFFPDTVDLTSLLERYRPLVLQSRLEQEVAWDSFEHDNWDPILIGEHFFVAPSWVKAATPAGRIRMTIDATKAFGTGRHESTQLAIEALEKYTRPGDSVMDIGCGSGILSHAAALLGAGSVVSGDLDPAAIETAAALKITGLSGQCRSRAKYFRRPGAGQYQRCGYRYSRRRSRPHRPCSTGTEWSIGKPSVGIGSHTLVNVDELVPNWLIRWYRQRNIIEFWA